jgi:hypothetical protein
VPIGVDLATERVFEVKANQFSLRLVQAGEKLLDERFAVRSPKVTERRGEGRGVARQTSGSADECGSAGGEKLPAVRRGAAKRDFWLHV